MYNIKYRWMVDKSEEVYETYGKLSAVKSFIRNHGKQTILIHDGKG